MLTQSLAEFVVSPGVLPLEMRQHSINALIDTIGCGLLGSVQPASELARRWASHIEAAPRVTVWGSSLRTSASEAAFVNGIAAHVDDYDDTHATLHGHPSTTLIPTVMACAELLRASGARMLDAYALGLEVGARVSRALGPDHYQRGWHNTATAGVFSCATAAAILFGANPQQMRNAWGLAASQSAGLLRNFGTMTKAFHAGNAARSGVHSAWLATEGFTADPKIWEGKGSFIEVYGVVGGALEQDLVGGLGTSWEVLRPGVEAKTWACCYQAHRAIVGLMQLLPDSIPTPDEITGVNIGFAPGSDAALIYDNPETELEGKFSIQYTVAAWLLDGKLSLDSFTDAMVNRVAVRSLMKKIRRYVVPDERRGYSGTVGYTDVEVVTKSQVLKKRVDQSETRAAWVVTDDEHDKKFLDCAARNMGGDRARELLGMLRSCAQLADVSPLARATAGKN